MRLLLLSFKKQNKTPLQHPTKKKRQKPPRNQRNKQGQKRMWYAEISAHSLKITLNVSSIIKSMQS